MPRSQVLGARLPADQQPGTGSQQLQLSATWGPLLANKDESRSIPLPGDARRSFDFKLNSFPLDNFESY